MSEQLKRNLLIIIPNLGRGGAQQVYRQQLAYLSKDFEVTGCVFNWNGAFPEDQHAGMVSLDVPGGKNLFEKVWYFFLRIIRLQKLKRLKQINVSISHLEGADYVNLLSGKADKKICWIHGTKHHDANIEGWLGSLRMKWLMPILYNRADQIVTVSQGIAKELLGAISGLENRIQVIYNGFDVEQIITKSREPIEASLEHIFNTSKVLITHCRLSRQKNLEALITIFSRIDRSETKLFIVGDGELRNALIQLGTQLDLSVWNAWDNTPLDVNSEVFFVGQQTNPFNYLRPSFLYMMTSGWEGFPLALCEAMACGLPVISTDCFTGPREIIAPELSLPQPVKAPFRSENGTVMPLAEDENSLMVWVNEINAMLSKKDFVANKIGAERIKNFSLAKSMEQTHQIIVAVSR